MGILICLTTFSQKDSLSKKDSSVTPVLDKAEHLVDKYSAKIADVFIATMDKATPVAKEGFRALVGVQIAYGVSRILPLLFFLLFWRLAVVEYNRVEGILRGEKVPSDLNSNYGPFHEENINPKMICYLVATIIAAIVALFSTYDGIMHLIAPKWYAIEKIIEMVK